MGQAVPEGDGDRPLPAARAAGKHLRVLVVDPDPAHRTLMEQRLRRQGHTPTVTSNCNEAWDLMQHQEFDTVIVDLETPAITALELCRRIDAGPQSPFVIGTSPNVSAAGKLAKAMFVANGVDTLIDKDKGLRSFAINLKNGMRSAGVHHSRKQRRTAAPPPDDAD